MLGQGEQKPMYCAYDSSAQKGRVLENIWASHSLFGQLIGQTTCVMDINKSTCEKVMNRR
ncbi:hypothetical protein CR513_01305, partial [Mucuna pruriens]